MNQTIPRKGRCREAPDTAGTTRITRNDLAYRKIGESYVAILTDEGRMVFLNGTAGEVLKWLDSGVREQQVPHELSRTYDIDLPTAQSDFEKVRADFCKVGLIQEESASTSASDVPTSLTADVDLRHEIKAHCVRSMIPLQAFIEVTNACNLRCTHCYLSRTAYKRTIKLRLINDLLTQLRDLGCLEIVFTGGEPLVHKHLLKACERARELRFSVVVKSNAALLNEDFVSEFRRLHITEVQVSLYSMNATIHDAITKKPGSHAKTIDALRKCASAGQRTRLSCVVMRSNFKHLTGLKEFAQELRAPIGFDLLVTRCHDGSTASLNERLGRDDLCWLDTNGFMQGTIFGDGTHVRTEEDSKFGLQEYPIEDPSSRPCGAACTIAAIDSFGEVRPCIAFPFSLGNVRDQPLTAILSDANSRARFIRSFTNASFEECSGCDLISACPRCMAVVMQETGACAKRAEAICDLAVYHKRYGG